MKKRIWIAGAAFVALAVAGGLWAAIGRADAGARKPALDCCFDSTCPPGCKPSCPPDCVDQVKPQAKPSEKKAKGYCPPCEFCP